MSGGFHVFCLLKIAAKCTQTYHFGDKKFFFLGGAQPRHHTQLPSTPMVQWH